MSKEIIVNPSINGAPALVTLPPEPDWSSVTAAFQTLLSSGNGAMNAAISELQISLTESEKAYYELQKATVALINRSFAEIQAVDQNVAASY